MKHEKCDDIIQVSKSIDIYIWIASSIVGVLVLWATYITIEVFAGKTADAVQLTKYDTIIEKLDKIERKLDKQIGE